MNVPEGYATLPRVDLQAPRPVGRPRGPAGSQDRSRHFMLRLNVGWTEEQKLTVKEKGADTKITRELVGPRTLATGQLCACFALKAPRNASWLNRNVIEGNWIKSSSGEMGRFYAECRAAAAEEGPALPLATGGERGAFRSPEPVVRFGVDGLDPSAAPRARKTSALIVELWRARTMGDIAASVRT